MKLSRVHLVITLIGENNMLIATDYYCQKDVVVAYSWLVNNIEIINDK